jgi:hypothetical protein
MNFGVCALLVDGEVALVVLEILGVVDEVGKDPARSKAWSAVLGEVPRGGCTWTEGSGQGRLGTRSPPSSDATKRMRKGIRGCRNREERMGRTTEA